MCDVGVDQPECGELGAHRVAALDAHRRQHDLTFAYRDVEVFRGSHRLDGSLGQGELVLGCKLGEHRKSCKQGFLTLPDLRRNRNRRGYFGWSATTEFSSSSSLAPAEFRSAAINRNC